MRKNYFIFSMLVIVVSFLRFILPSLTPLSTPGSIHILKPREAEACFALGLKYPFSHAGVYELELIPGISDVLAYRIMEDKENIMNEAKKLFPEAKHYAFERVFGIGSKTAKHLGKYLSLE